MPLYEYECRACGDVNEVLQKISDPAPEACESCQQGPMVKRMSRTSFVLKGSGWYVTDFRESSSKKNQGDKQADAAKPSPSDTSGADASSPPAKGPAADPAPASASTKSKQDSSSSKSDAASK